MNHEKYQTKKKKKQQLLFHPLSIHSRDLFKNNNAFLWQET